MGTLLEIIVVLAILASFVLAYFSAKTWRIYQVILVEMVFLAAVPFSYMAVRTLKIHQSWRSTEQAWRKAVERVDLQNVQLLSGKQEQDRLVEAGIEQLRHELERLTHDRGYAWFDAAYDGFDPKTNTCHLTIESPDPHEIAAKSVVFVFEQAKIEDGGQYVGEFKVTKAQAKEKEIEIEPNLPLSATQTAALKKKNMRWALYAVMPVDNAELFAAMDAAERQKLIPKASQQEFADKKRTLRDYELFFHQNALECDLLADNMIETKADIARSEAAEQKAQADITYRKSEQGELTADLEKFRYERQVIAKYAQTLLEQAKSLKTELKTAFAATVRYAQLLEKLQTKAADEIDRRSAEQASIERPRGAAP